MAANDWLKQSPHRRWNPLLREWVLVSPHRTQRPWQGEVANAAVAQALRHDPDCYLCPGNVRANGERNPAYRQTFVFDNDYAALLPHSESQTEHRESGGLLRAEMERGLCRVLCFDPDHSLTLAGMSVPAIERVVDAWQAQYRELRDIDWVSYVQIFENRGAMMGASNPHPHGQIWATEHVPDQPLREAAGMADYAAEHGGCLLCDYAQLELQIAERVVCANAEFMAVVPWWAVWPFEALVLPLRHVEDMAAFDARQSAGLADILKQLTMRYDALFQVSFPYTMGFHQGSTGSSTGTSTGSVLDGASAHFHAHFYPPLLRSATVRKFMVGFEMLGMPQRDITPEIAAERLRSVLQD